MLTTTIAVLFTLILVVGVPALSLSNAANADISKLPRIDLYLSTIVSQWVLTLLGLVVVSLAARPVLAMGFAAMPLALLLEWGGGISAVALLGLILVVWCERRGWLPREPDLVYLLMPETPREKVWAALIVAPTAAFCEEFLFRGFLLTELHTWLHSVMWAWVASSAAFGVAHCYQGWSGAIRAGLLGALLAYAVVRWGNLYPAMLAHWLIDVVALLWLGGWMVGRNSPESGVEGPEAG